MTNQSLAATSCALHPHRVAAARCPSCRHFFCAECVTEHDGRFLCATCLAREDVAPVEKKRLRWIVPVLSAIVQFAVAFLIVGALYYIVAGFLSDIPDAFHDGTIWE